MDKEEKRKYDKERYQKNKEKLQNQHKDWEEKNPNYHKKYREKNIDKIKISDKIQYAKNKEKRKEDSKKWRKENPKKAKAHDLVKHHIKIPKGQLCETCKIKKARDKHHEDYNKPLEVIFLCRGCHRRIHQKVKGG